MRRDDTIDDDQSLGLAALAWTLGDDTRAVRLLDVTGLSPATLRERVGDPQVIAAVLAFLATHEPDLVACASAIGVKPEALVRAHAMLDAQ